MYKKVKSIKHYGGGGSGMPTPTIPDWMRPGIEGVVNQAGTLYSSGDLSHVAGTSPLQDLAFGQGADGISSATTGGLATLKAQQDRLSGLATAPSAETLAAQKAGIVQDAQKRVSGLNTQFGGTGTLGSARQAVMQGAQNAETTGQLAKVDAEYEDKMFKNRLAAEGALGSSVGAGGSLASQGASGLAQLGGQQRTIDQAQQDAPWQGLSRMASTVFGNPTRQQASAGGK